MIRLSHSVMHAAFDPARKAMLDGFLCRLGEPTVIVADQDRDGILKTALRAWEAHDPSSDYHIVFQDDMWAQCGALDRMRNILSNVNAMLGDAVVSFFQPAIGAPRVIHEYIGPWYWHGDGLIKYDRVILWGGTIAVPTKFVHQMVRDIRRFYPPEQWNQADDEKICFWAWKKGIPTYCYAPSLLEHVGWDRSVTRGNTADFWARGLLLADEADRSDPAWVRMMKAVDIIREGSQRMITKTTAYDELGIEKAWP